MSSEQKRIGDLEIVARNLLAIAKEHLSNLGPCEHDINICICDLKEQVEVAEEVLAGNYYHAWGTEKDGKYRCDKCGRIYESSAENYICIECGAMHPARLQHEG